MEIPLVRGRDFSASDREGAPRVAVVTKRWRAACSTIDPMGREFQMLDGADRGAGGRRGAERRLRQTAGSGTLWIPLALPESVATDRGARFLTALGRLKRGVTVEQANAQLKLVAVRQVAEVPDSNHGWTPSVEPFRNNFLSPATKNSLWLLLAAVGFLWRGTT